MQTLLHRARFLCYVLAVAILNLSLLQSPLRAELIATDSAMVSPATNDSSRARVRAALERADVQAELQSYGVDPNEAMIRVDSLTDTEASQLAANLDAQPAGQGAIESEAAISSAAYWGVLLGLILFVVLIVWLIHEASEAKKAAPANEAPPTS